MTSVVTNKGGNCWQQVPTSFCLQGQSLPWICQAKDVDRWERDMGM